MFVRTIALYILLFGNRLLLCVSGVTLVKFSDRNYIVLIGYPYLSVAQLRSCAAIALRVFWTCICYFFLFSCHSIESNVPLCWYISKIKSANGVYEYASGSLSYSAIHAYRLIFIASMVVRILCRNGFLGFAIILRVLTISVVKLTRFFN